MSQFDSYNAQHSSNLKKVLKNLSESNMSDAQIKDVLKELLSPQQPMFNQNSQFGDH